MMRCRQRKTVEELYGNKFYAPKSQVMATQKTSGQKTGSATERNCGYIISSNEPYHEAVAPAVSLKNVNTGKDTSRRKSARPSNKMPNEKQGKEFFAMDDGRRSPAIQPTKGEKVSNISPALTNVYDNNAYGNYKHISPDNVSPHQQHQHQHHNHHNHYNHHDDDKDDDSDEFFDLIRRTVESAIGKSISELLNRNFREMSSKVDRFSAELKTTNGILSQMKKELNNTIGHYGEENSRHFRYLCMKSEYDKMFYQHQALIANNRLPSAEIISETKLNEKRNRSTKPGKRTSKVQCKEDDQQTNAPVACVCRTTSSKSPSVEYKEPHKTSSADISHKSSDVGMHEVLEHIQKFCNQMQFNEFKSDGNKEIAGTSQQRNIMRHEDLVKINKEIFREDDEDDNDDWEINSDEMTPRNIPNDAHIYGGNTSRGSITHRGNNGAGDG